MNNNQSQIEQPLPVSSFLTCHPVCDFALDRTSLPIATSGDTLILSRNLVFPASINYTLVTNYFNGQTDIGQWNLFFHRTNFLMKSKVFIESKPSFGAFYLYLTKLKTIALV